MCSQVEKAINTGVFILRTVDLTILLHAMSLYSMTIRLSFICIPVEYGPHLDWCIPEVYTRKFLLLTSAFFCVDVV